MKARPAMAHPPKTPAAPASPAPSRRLHFKQPDVTRWQFGADWLWIKELKAFYHSLSLSLSVVVPLFSSKERFSVWVSCNGTLLTSSKSTIAWFLASLSFKQHVEETLASGLRKKDKQLEVETGTGSKSVHVLRTKAVSLRVVIVLYAS